MASGSTRGGAGIGPDPADPAVPPSGVGRGAAATRAGVGRLAGMRVAVLLPHPDVDHISCPHCGQPADLSNVLGRRRREWACPTCRAAGTIRIAGHPTPPRATPTRAPLNSA